MSDLCCYVRFNRITVRFEQEELEKPTPSALSLQSVAMYLLRHLNLKVLLNKNIDQLFR